MLKTELKIVLRRPIWLIFIAFVAWVGMGGYTFESTFGLDFPPFEQAYKSGSLGDWGRGVVQSVGSFLSMFFSLFIAFITTAILSSEFRHRDVLWSTPRGGIIKLSMMRVGTLSSVITFLVLMGMAVCFLNTSTREVLVLAGWQYLPLYVALLWLHIAVWVALTMLFFELTRSRAWTSFTVLATQAFWFWTAMFVPGRGSFVQLLQRNLIVWNFLSSFNPLGVLPIAFFLQGAMVLGLVLTLIGIVHLRRRRLPQGGKLRETSLVVALGLAIIVGTAMTISYQLRSQIAPFSVKELWDGQAVFDRFYIWSSDFRFLAHPEPYTAVCLPPAAPLPGWLTDLSKDKDLRRYDGLGHITTQVDGRGIRTTEPRTFVVVRPLGEQYPPDCKLIVQRYWQNVQPVFERARPWLKSVQKEPLVLWPEEGLRYYPVFLPTGDLGVTLSYISWRSGRVARWDVAEALARYLSPVWSIQGYVQLYLMLGLDEDGVNQALQWLQDQSQRESDPRFDPWDPRFEPRVLRGPSFFPHFWKPKEAAQVLSHWQRGEEMGHENYIRMHLAGGKR